MSWSLGGGAYGSLMPEVLVAGSSWMMSTAKGIHGCIQPQKPQ